MKCYTVIFFAGFLFTASACKNHSQPSAASDLPKTDSVTNAYFPIADFLQSEIRNIDTSVLVILQCETIRQRTDTSFLTPNEFNRAAAVFLTRELIPDSLEKNYAESSFEDKTTGYLTFTYSPRDKDQSLHRIDVLMSPDNNGVNKVKSIYMEKSGHVSDTAILKKMYWQAGHSFQVITNLQSKGHTVETRQLKVVWNDDRTD